MDILHLVDRMERVMKMSRRIGNFRLVDERRIWPILDQMRISIPDAVRRADRLTREREKTIAHAQEEAERVVSIAHNEMAQLTAEHSILLAAQEQSDAIRADAEREAEEIRRGADEYAFDMLCSLEQELRRSLTIVENGIRLIQNDQEAGTSGDLLQESGRTSSP
jgi:cell division septum initiation protein DivIVA